MASAPMTRAERTAQTKQHILAVGRDLFREHGYEHVSVEMITRAAGVSVGSFYHYFGSKSGLLEEMSSGVNQYFSIPADIDYAKDDCKERVCAFYKTFCDALTQYDDERLYAMFFVRGGNKTLVLHNRNYRTMMKEMLLGFQRAGKLRADCSVDEIEDLLMTGLFGVQYHWITCERVYSFYDRMRRMQGSVIESFLA